MADNTTLNTGTGGDTIRDKDRAGVKTQIVALDLNPAGSESLMAGALPVTDNAGSLTVDDGGGSLTVDGTVTVGTAPAQAADGGTLPAVTDVVSGYDGTNVQVIKTDVNGIVQVAQNGAVDTELTTADLDTGAGTDTRAVVGLVGSKSGGAQLIPGDATKGLAVDLTATGQNTTALKVDGSGVTQPVSGTVTANAGSGTFAVSGTVTANAGSGTMAVDSELTTADLDTGAGTDTRAVVGLVGSKSGGGVLIPGDATKGLAVDLTNTGANATAIKVDNSAVTQPVSGTVTANAGTGTFNIQANASVNNAQVAGTTTDTNSGNKSAGTQRVVLATDQPALTNPLLVQGQAATSGGYSFKKVISAASTNATSVKASAGQVYGWFISNINASPRYLKLYNKASAPTVGTDVPDLTILIPGNASGAGATVDFSSGITFGTGIALALTTGVGDTDASAVAANDIVINLLYK